MRWLMVGGLIAPGHIFTCRIEDLTPRDLAPFTQFHAFAGMGVWSYALRLAGWPDDRPVWTGSCPCQPFSSAGKGAGFADERHLWPAYFHLVTTCRPQRVIGEQVAGKNGLAWLDLVSADLEGNDYACRAVPLCSAGFGASDIRNRVYWVADSIGAERPNADRRERDAGFTGRRVEDPSQAAGRGLPGRLADGQGGGWREERPDAQGLAVGDRAQGDAARPVDGRVSDGPGPVNGFWRDADWLFCRDGKWRPVEPGSFPLAARSPARVGRLRTAGNAINAQVAKEFIAALMAEDLR